MIGLAYTNTARTQGLTEGAKSSDGAESVRPIETPDGGYCLAQMTKSMPRAMPARAKSAGRTVKASPVTVV